MSLMISPLSHTVLVSPSSTTLQQSSSQPSSVSSMFLGPITNPAAPSQTFPTTSPLAPSQTSTTATSGPRSTLPLPFPVLIAVPAGVLVLIVIIFILVIICCVRCRRRRKYALKTAGGSYYGTCNTTLATG